MVTYKRTPQQEKSADFSAKTMREWDDILKILKDKNCHPTIPYPASLSLRCKRKKKKDFPQQKLREFNNIRPALQEILKKTFTRNKVAKTTQKFSNTIYQSIKVKGGRRKQKNNCSSLGLVTTSQHKKGPFKTTKTQREKKERMSTHIGT